MIGPLAAGLLVPAGVLAGAAGSAGGITSLVSYPALLLAGVPALPANVANQVALVTSWPGSALGSREELRGRSRWLLRWGVFTAVGSAAGAVLLTVTSSRAFAHVVPILVVIGSLALLAEPALQRLRRVEPGQRPAGAGLAAALVALSLYNGYFGAGSGVMTLTLMLLTVDRRLPYANALKNMLVGVATVVAAIIFVLRASVTWSAVIPLAAGVFLGSRIGPIITRRVPPAVLRVAVAMLGLGLAVDLWLSA